MELVLFLLDVDCWAVFARGHRLGWAALLAAASGWAVGRDVRCVQSTAPTPRRCGSCSISCPRCRRNCHNCYSGRRAAATAAALPSAAAVSRCFWSLTAFGAGVLYLLPLIERWAVAQDVWEVRQGALMGCEIKWNPNRLNWCIIASLARKLFRSEFHTAVPRCLGM